MEKNNASVGISKYSWGDVPHLRAVHVNASGRHSQVNCVLLPTTRMVTQPRVSGHIMQSNALSTVTFWRFSTHSPAVGENCPLGRVAQLTSAHPQREEL